MSNSDTDRWTTDQVIAWLAEQGRVLSPVTWRSYASRQQAPAPEYVGRTPTWTQAEVAEWHRTRTRTKPGQREDVTSASARSE